MFFSDSNVSSIVSLQLFKFKDSTVSVGKDIFRNNFSISKL